ncbi:Armadillo repeat-containing protein 2 [Phytophthora boehmeriae]|uniref:Armadillo repeat-containing protein 2 n=1 Tax=Phytophthora boehmeriae TaxID=109152 RepID=A0A8T1X0G3_9STRA|nr:Armadillo repeat-containing protein 2 [Phytophthora boehmeriae]
MGKPPSRSSGPKAGSAKPAPSSEAKLSFAVSASTSSLKLVHAPILTDDESDGELAVVNGDNKAIPKSPDSQLDLEASLALPSNDELEQSYSEIKSYIDEILARKGPEDVAADVEELRSLVDSFTSLSSFFQAANKYASEDTSASKLRLKLFDLLSNVLLEKWSSNAACVLELAPALLNLFYAISTGDGSDKASSHIIKLGKTLFVLSKDSSNDDCFCNVRYVEAVLQAIAETSNRSTVQLEVDDKEIKENEKNVVALVHSANREVFPMKMLIYAAGTLKNISNAEDKMTRLLATNRAIAILSETMLWQADNAAKQKEIAQLLIQTTGILRNLSVTKTYLKQFIEAHIPLRLCNMIPAFLPHQELMVNVSRILSKLTLHELPRAQINTRCSNMHNLMTLVDHRQNSWLSLGDQQSSETRFQDLLFIRVFFVLGNLCAGNDQNRILVACKFSGIVLLLEVLQFYAGRYSDARSASDAESSENQLTTGAEQTMDVLVKMIRVLANLAINAEVGALINENEGLSSLLAVLEAAHQAGDEELMLNAVSCITNVSYYSTERKDADQDNHFCFVETNRIAITRLLSRILMDRNEEAVVEATRAFGNLSRFKDVLAYMSEVKVLDCLVVLLDHSNREIVHTVCGVLMNAALDPSTRQALLAVRPNTEDDATDVRCLLVGIVEYAAGDDLEMTLIASKALYNLLLSKDAVPKCGNDVFESEAANLRRVIEEILGTFSRDESAGKKLSDGAGAEPHGGGDEDSDSWNSRKELRLVLPQLLRSINAVYEGT